MFGNSNECVMEPLNETRNPSNASPSQFHQIWQPVFISELAAHIILVLLNGFVLSIYVYKKSLRTPFTIYIVALLSSNIFYALARNLLDIINGVYGVWWTGERSCDLYSYANWIAYTFPIHSHILISINRIWAISFPISYSRYHTKKVAVLLCALMVLYVHAVALYGYMMDALYYRLPLKENGCNLNVARLKTYTVVNIILMDNLPLIVILTSCPVLLYQVRHRARAINTGKIHYMSKLKILNGVSRLPMNAVALSW